MRFFLSTFFLFACVFHSYGQLPGDAIDRLWLDQQNAYLSNEPANKGLLQVGASVEAASSAVTNSFFKASLVKGNITNDDKDVVSKRLKAHNRLGADLNFSINGIYHASKISILAGVGHRELWQSTFSKALFETVFRGNKMYAGQQVSLAAKASYLNYDYLYVGAAKSIKNVTLYGTANLLRGGQWMQIDMPKADMYTQTDGEYIDFNTQMKLNYSDNKLKTFPSTKGIGAAATLGVTWQKEKHKINFEARDLGFISWNKQTVIAASSNYHYEGLEVNDLLSASIFNTSNINIDTLSQKLKATKTTERITSTLPATFLLNYSYQWRSNFRVFLLAKHLTQGAYIPKITLRGQYTFGKSWHIIPSISYGGFGRQAIELGVIKSFRKAFVVSANLFCLEYLILPKQTGGGGLNFSLIKLF